MRRGLYINEIEQIEQSNHKNCNPGTDDQIFEMKETISNQQRWKNQKQDKEKGLDANQTARQNQRTTKNEHPPRKAEALIRGGKDGNKAGNYSKGGCRCKGYVEQKQTVRQKDDQYPKELVSGFQRQGENNVNKAPNRKKIERKKQPNFPIQMGGQSVKEVQKETKNHIAKNHERHGLTAQITGGQLDHGNIIVHLIARAEDNQI